MKSAFFRCGSAVLLAVTLLAGCIGRDRIDTPPSMGAQTPSASVTPSAPQGSAPGSAASAALPAGRSYIDQVVQEYCARIQKPGMSEYERAKAAFDYVIANTSLVEPVGLDLWRIRGDKNQPQPSYVENRSLSVLLYGIGMCEDYAAAFTMLLRGMGLEAEYVPGLTYSTEGALVDHAWVVAKIDGIWYHLDCQLEDNISRHGAIRYRYFMRGDDTLAASHRWGQNLIDSGLLTAEQNAEIARHYLPPVCPEDYPTPVRQSFTDARPPDPTALQVEIDAEFRQYTHLHGPLAPLELHIIPPVFGTEGYGPAE